MLAWPSISCTARRSCEDCNKCVAKEWRSMCGCTCSPRPLAGLEQALLGPHRKGLGQRKASLRRANADDRVHREILVPPEPTEPAAPGGQDQRERARR